MSFVYLTSDPPEEFPSPDSNSPTVLLNTHTQKFCLIAQPSLQELRLGVEQYGNVRLEAHWKALLEPLTHTPTRIRFFQSHGGQLLMVEYPSVWKHFNVTSTTQMSKRLVGVSISEQRELVLPLKPKSIPEMLALYKDTKTVDMTGYRYLVKVLDSSKSAFEFFGALVDALFLQIEQSDHSLGRPEAWIHQARVFEFLGTAVQKKWLLFPFAHRSSGLWEHLALHHGVNVNCYFNEDYRPKDAAELIDSIQSVFAPKTTHAGALGHLRSLMVASTYRAAEQTSTALLARCHSKMSAAGRAMSVQTANMAKRTYNHLVKIHNSKADARFAQALLTNAKKAASLEDFSSFQYLLEVDQKWAQWALLFEGFVQSTADSLGQVRKTACRDFADFLLSLENAPTQPHHLLRHHINDYADGSGTFRKWLQGKCDSPAVRNSRLQQVSQLFEFLLDRLLKERRDPEEPVPRFQNPVDMRMDRFSETYKGGTHRKAIGAEIMETMRNILVEDDYAWSKANTTYNWVHLIDATTGTLEYVWCPSSTIAMFTLLSVPLRGLQTRLLDSGEGDAMVYDFDTNRMVANQNQLPVSGQLDLNRSEGVLQVMASGMLGVTDFVGMWIATNKTSDTGYPIPWINEDLMKHLRYQREWIARYSPGPEMYGISDAQGHRNAPAEWKGLEKKFFCLFRDPAAERSASLSLPVSKQKIYKLWNNLCAEAERRINSEARNASGRVILIKPESVGTGSPKAMHDIHTLRVSGITDLLNRGVPLHIVSEYVAGHATYMMTLWYDKMPAGLVRDFLVKCKAEAGNSTSPLPKFTEEEIKDLAPFLMCNPKYEGMYTGFDALEENKGLAIIRQSGICPGTRCEEGGLDDNGRVAPVPIGDRGPSCPQCRFWMTGPAFLLGQVIEGNQLIFKIRKKIGLLAKLRERTMDAEDSANEQLAALLRGQTDVEERQLNDMLTEWWHRIRFFESSVLKLDEFIQAQRSKKHPESDHAGHRVILIKEAFEQKVDYGFTKSTELELNHFLSTCAEILPEYSVDCSSAPQDIELAVGKFLAINDESEMATMLFKLSEEQRLTAANLTIEVLLSTLENPNQVEEILEGRPLLEALPGVRQDLAKMFAKGASPSLTEPPKKVRLKKGLS